MVLSAKPAALAMTLVVITTFAGPANAAELSEPRITALMAEAKGYLMDQDYDRAIQIYDRLLAEPDAGHHPLALEYRAVAQEKTGQLDLARSEYEAYLVRYQEGSGAYRVQQRLAALVARDQPEQPPATVWRQKRWEVFGNISQDYLRDSNRWREGTETIVGQSALLTLGDLSVVRRGDRFDIGARVNGGYQQDFLPDDTGPGNQGLVSYALIELRDQKLDWSARLGRQSLHTDGILGRFDGLRASYQWRPRVAFHVTAGSPVDTPRYAADTDRQFVGASAALGGVGDAWNVRLFTAQQKNAGIWDRQAVGAELRYRAARWNVLGMIDYDVSYGALNSAFLVGNWQLTDRLQVYGRANLFAVPYLTTRNALIGQSVATLDELLDSYNAAQIRTLARNRTADARQGSAGFSATLSQRWNFNAEALYYSVGETLGSGGVESFPESGPQLFYSARLIGSSFLKDGDTFIVGFRLNSSQTADTSTLLVDTRLPLGSAFRVSPRVSVSWRDASPSGDQQLFAEASIRLTYRPRGRYRLELEGGSRWSARDVAEQLLLSPLYPDDREESIGYYFNVRWGIEF